MVERDHLCVAKMTREGPRHISGTGSHIQQGEVLIRMHEIPHHPKQSSMTSKPPIDAGKFAQIPIRMRRPGTLQQFRL